MPAIKPTRPVRRGCSQGFFAGRYKTTPEDFVVDELPAYEPSGQGDHAFLWIEKRGLSTIDLLDELGRRLDRHPKSFGVAGLKDAQAVSRQWVSVEHVDTRAVEALRGDRFAVLRVARHGNKLKLGHLRGNRFSITLRGTAPDDLARAQHNLAELQRVGVPNYFGEQRFGKRGANLQKGLDILHGDPVQFARKMPRRVFGLVLSAVQSELFNRVVMKRLQGLGTLLAGDLAFLHRNGATFPIEDPAREQPRADSFEISPSGPMPGPKMAVPDGEPRALEVAALEELGVDPDRFWDLPFGVAAGERRPLRIPVTECAAEAVEGGLRLQFALPRGSYATSVLRELLTDTIWFEQRT